MREWNRLRVLRVLGVSWVLRLLKVSVLVCLVVVLFKKLISEIIYI